MTTQRAKLISEARLPYLTDRERRTLARFLDRLEAHAGDRVQHVIFFGSKARGDAEAYSDIDLMVVADVDADELRTLAADLETDDGVALMPQLWSSEEYEHPDKPPSFTAEQLRQFPAEAERFVARIELFLEEHGFEPTQDE